MIENPNFIFGVLCGSCISFIVAIFTLDRYYKECSKKWMEEIISQYNKKIGAIIQIIAKIICGRVHSQRLREFYSARQLNNNFCIRMNHGRA